MYRAWYFCTRPDISVQCLIFLYNAWYFCTEPDIFLQRLIFLYNTWYFCTEPDMFLQCLKFLSDFNRVWSFPTDFHKVLPAPNFTKIRYIWRDWGGRWTCRNWQVLSDAIGTRIKQSQQLNPLNPELNPICYLLALLGAHHFLHVSRIRVKSLTLRLLMSSIWSTHYWCF